MTDPGRGEETDSPLARPRWLYTAFENVDRRRHPETREWYEDLPSEPVPAHALRAASTRDGDPWPGQGTGSVRHPYFYGNRGPRALCGAEVLALVPIKFNTADPDACPKCVEELRSPKPRASSRFFEDRCGAFIRMQDVDDVADDDTDGSDAIALYTCTKPYGHDDVHRSGSGAIWLTGPDDFVPPPDRFV